MLSYLLLLDDPSDAAEFTAAYEANINLMLQAARKFFPEQKGNHNIAEDVVHEAFIAVALNFKKYLSIPCPKRPSYLVTIVKHKCIDIQRRAARHLEVDLECAMDMVPPESDLGEDCALAKELMHELPEKYRLVLECRLLMDMSHKEIAAHLGITEDLASKQYNRGRAMLKERLREEGISRG